MRAYRLIALVSAVIVLLVLSRPLTAISPAPGVAAVSPTPIAHPGITVNNPTVLPPAGNIFGWVDSPCATQVRFDADWSLPGGQHYTGIIAEADSMIVSDIGTPALRTEGSDVLSTFGATLRARITTMDGQPLAHPAIVSIPGQMTVRLVGKAGRTTGVFLIVLEDMTFSDNSFLVKLDASRRSGGAITVTDIGGGLYSVECGVDVFSMFSLNPGANPPQWFPLCHDLEAPTHYELLAASCPAGTALAAGLSYLPSAPANGRAVAFTDHSTGGPIAWSWSFGDGASSNQQHPTHVFAAPGTYPVRLLVQSASAASSQSVAVRVGPLWGHGGPGPRRALHGVPVPTPHAAAPR
jgi:hypothetical protein